jgi:hypothetical protein
MQWPLFVLLLMFFYIDCFQFFTFGYYYIPCIIVCYCTMLSHVSSSYLGCGLLLLALASLYTHDMLFLQWIPLIPTVVFTSCMIRFFYKRNVIPYTSVSFGILCSYSIPQLMPVMLPFYIKITPISCSIILLMTNILTHYCHKNVPLSVTNV